MQAVRGGRLPLESVAGLLWNRWPLSLGNPGCLAPEYAGGLVARGDLNGKSGVFFGVRMHYSYFRIGWESFCLQLGWAIDRDVRSFVG